jgi:competence protein ComEA
MAGPRGGKNILDHPAFVPVVWSVSAALVVAGLAVAFLRTGFGLNNGLPAGGTPSVLSNQSHVTAYIVGAVVHPGVYTLVSGARIGDLLAAAGGARTGADLVRVDLAALVFDGEEVYVPLVGEPFPDNVGSGILVNINIASAETMHLQLGITLKIATQIVTYRQAHGLFTAVDQLLLVPISRTIYDRIKDLVTV